MAEKTTRQRRLELTLSRAEIPADVRQRILDNEERAAAHTLKTREEIERRIAQLQSEKMRRLYTPGGQRLYGQERHDFIIMTEGAMRALKWVIGEWVLEDER